MRVCGDVGRDVEDVDLRIVVVVMRLMFGDGSGGYGEYWVCQGRDETWFTRSSTPLTSWFSSFN